MKTKDVGKLAEDAVSHYLVNHQFVILSRNYLCYHVGELDIVAQRDDELFIFEVKARSKNSFLDDISESINSIKRIRIERTTRAYIHEFQLYESNIRYFAAWVTLCGPGIIQKIE